MKRAVLFDLDGILDTLDDLADSMNAALERTGFPSHPVSSYRYFVGDGVDVLGPPRAAIQGVYSFFTCSTSRGHGRRIRPEMASQEPSL